MKLIFTSVLMFIGFIIIGYVVGNYFSTGSTEHMGFAFVSVCLTNIFFTYETFSQLKKRNKMKTDIQCTEINR